MINRIYILIFLIICSSSIFGRQNEDEIDQLNLLLETMNNNDISMDLKLRIATRKSLFGKSYNWEKSSRKLYGMDEQILNFALDEIHDMAYINSLVIIKDGALVKEEYYNGGNEDVMDLTYSVTKSVMSILVGIAIDKGYIESLDQKMIDFFPEYNVPSLDPRKKDITIRHLLSMQSGFDYELNIIDEMRAAPNMIQAIINSELQFDPGTSYIYSTHGSHLLSGIITKATKMSTKAFAKKYLFKPLGIKSFDWSKDQNGIFFGGAGIFLTPRDMARIGFLYLRKGKINNRQIVSEEWIDNSTKNYRDYTNTLQEMKDLGYGFQWWTGKLYEYPVYYAAGYGGQWILVVPELDLVIVTTMDAVTEKEDWNQMSSLIPVVYNYLIPLYDDKHKPYETFYPNILNDYYYL